MLCCVLGQRASEREDLAQPAASLLRSDLTELNVVPDGWGANSSRCAEPELGEGTWHQPISLCLLPNHTTVAWCESHKLAWNGSFELLSPSACG